MDNRLTEAIKAGKFAIVGVANTLLDMGVFWLLSVLLGINPYISQVISYSCGMLNSYIFNRSWTFRSQAKFFSPALLRFIILNLIMLGISTGLLFVLLDVLAVPKMIAKVGATIITLVISFVVNRLWVFKE
ncbi:MAG: GtrA family protein [Angelakisella sp.]|nr:GtrA family protein [Angelakisella sp.]